MPKISFLGPIYNQAAWVTDAIKSLTDQTEKDIEIIYVDDGSTDGTKDVLNFWAKQDKRIKVFGLKKNVGLGKAWNIGIKLVKSPIIAPISGDDIWTKDRAKITIKAFESSDIDVFYGSFWNCDATFKPIEFKPAIPYSKKKLLTPREDGFSTQYIGHFVSAYRKGVGLRYKHDESRKYGIDYNLFVQFAKENCRFGWTKKVLGYARINPNSVSFRHRQEIVNQDKELEKSI